MSKILVTGSEGSLMQAVIPKLLAQGHTVYGVDSLMRYGERRYIADAKYPFLCGDLVDPFFVDDVFNQAQPDYVIQAAARIYGVGGFNAYRADILGEDVTLHNNILKAAHNYNVKRVVYISSSMVYENIKDVGWAAREGFEELYPAPYTDYGLSKLVGERLSKAFMEQYLLPYTIWRPFNIITPYETVDSREQGVSHVFADFINNIVVKKLNPLPIIGSGDQVRCFTWIDDVAQAIADYSFSDETLNDTFNLGNDEPISMKDLAILIYNTAIKQGLLDTTTKPLEFERVLDFVHDVQYRRPSVEKTYKKLGWKANQLVDTSVDMCLTALGNKIKADGPVGEMIKL